MNKSVFEAVPNLENSVTTGTVHVTRIMEKNCRPGMVQQFSGMYEIILGMVREDLMNKSDLGNQQREEVLRRTRNYFMSGDVYK